MRVLIIEDEKAAAENLKFLLTQLDPSIVVEKVINTVSGAIEFFLKENTIELAFFDIHLADGISFEIFEKVQINIPIIFTTAYDEYALKAFKVNSIAYLLKPIDEDELREALVKYNNTQHSVPSSQQFQEMLQILQTEKKKYKSTYLVHKRDTLVPLGVNEIAYFTIDMGTVKAISFDENEYVIEKKLEDIEVEINPDHFFRANRQFIVQRKAIENLQLYFNGKLILNLNPKPSEQVVVSKTKAPRLKQWIS
jgi:two-component system LytT family response regulator